MKQIPMEPRRHKTITHHTVTPVQVHNRHFSPLNALITRLLKPSNRHFTFSLNAPWRGEAALLQVVLVASLDRHTVPGPRLQVRQGHQVGIPAQVPDI